MVSLFTRSLAALGLLLMLGVAGCGASSTAGTGNSTTTSITPTRAMNGCPTQLIPVDGSPHADVLLTGKGDAFDQVVSLPIGKVLEVSLSAAITWHLNLTDAASVLQPFSPQGFYSAAHQACIWEFSGNSAGQATLTFTGSPICQPHTQCPAIAAAQTYTINVA